MSWSNKYIGIPYKSGKSDCWALVRNIYKNELGIILPAYTIITPSLDEKINAVAQVYEEEKNNWLQVNKPYQTYDVLMFHLGGMPLHTGVVIDNEYMIHSESAKMGSCVEKYIDQKWQKRLIGVYRYVKGSL